MIEFKEELITPEIASKYLRKGSMKVRDLRRVKRYAKDMLEGKWRRGSADCIRVSKTDHLLDGNNRMHAVILANKPVWFHVATGLEDDVFDIIDCGAPRNGADVFKIAGVSAYTVLPSIINLYYQMTDETSIRRGRIGVTAARLLEYYEENPKMWDEVAKRSREWYILFQKILSPTVVGAVFARFHDTHPVESEDFMNQMCTGNDISNSTIRVLRKKLQDHKMSHTRMSNTYILALIIKTWNAFIKNRELSRVVFDPINESFPKIL